MCRNLMALTLTYVSTTFVLYSSNSKINYVNTVKLKIIQFIQKLTRFLLY